METIVFTNGCFDIIHPGHIDLLRQARALGTRLIVGINSDRSVREIKGETRPFLDQESRRTILSELRSVDEVRIFDENTPEKIIHEIKPHVLVKGGDWSPEQIIGADFVLKNGGRVFSIPFRQDISSSQIVAKILTQKQVTPKKLGEENKIGENFSDELQKNIQRGREFISQTIAAGGRILLASFSASEPVFKLAELLKSLYGANSVAAFEENSAKDGDLLVAIVGDSDALTGGAELVKARQHGARIIVIAGENGRKFAALSDISLFLSADSEEELNASQIKIANELCRTGQ